ncbi:MAG: hypothetical protein IT369_11140 [Candidatus Latescibacteria bacterium]|nr:hypothetical protein [Candidatus Latescibacterota bacterium]
METSVPNQTPQLRAGVARVDITAEGAGPVNDRLYAKALVLTQGAETVVLVTIDAVAIGEIGPIPNSFLPQVRARLQAELGLDSSCLLVNASHCHGVVCAEVEDRTVAAVQAAWQAQVPVRAGAGAGHEDRIMENRRLRLHSGREADVRRAYALPPDEAVAGVGPVDPQIGLLRLDREDGRTLAVVFNFACHPIQGVPSGGNTADLAGFACRVIEDHCGEGAMAFVLQGCAGDINPVFYTDVARPPDAESLGSLLGISALRGLTQITPRSESRLQLISETLALPRADLAGPIAELEAEQARLLQSLRGTSLNLKTFVPLLVKYRLAPEFPSYYAHRYLHDRALGREDLDRLDAENRAHLEAYTANILVMEELTRLQTNLGLLQQHQATNLAAHMQPLEVELKGLRLGDFVLLTFPGELSVEIGLELKRRSPHPLTFFAAYTNGYTYYSPTAQQLLNRGWAQEDSDCLLAPEWHPLFLDRALALLGKL